MAPSAACRPWRRSRRSWSLKIGVNSRLGATRSTTRTLYGVVSSGSSARTEPQRRQHYGFSWSSSFVFLLCVSVSLWLASEPLQVGEEVGIGLGDAAGVHD